MKTYTLINTADELDQMLTIIDENPAALDVEGWDYEVRCVQVCNDDVWFVCDFGEIGKGNWFKDVAHWFEDSPWIVFHSGHEKRCFAKAGVNPTCWDVGHLRRAVEGGGHMSLAKLVGWELNVEMDKTEQSSTWNTGELSQSQLDYAADDALVTWEVWKKLRERADADHMAAFNMLDGMTDAVIEMEETGLQLDQTHHRELIVEWQRLLAEREKKIRELVTIEEIDNLNSGKQFTDWATPMLPDEALAIWPTTPKTGMLSTKNEDLMNMAALLGVNPFTDLLRLMAERSTLVKYLSSFGESLITHAQKRDGRVHARYNIGAAITGRFSSSAPNLQQIPRDRDFFGQRLSIRKGFVAAPGRKLISYDYSGIEMRVMALESGDKLLLEDVIYGDVHSEAASLGAGRKIDPKASVEDKELRQGGKPINFGIIYGTTGLGLAGRQGWTVDFADGVIQKWAGRYPNAYDLRTKVQAEATSNKGYIRMVDGGTIWMGDPAKRIGITRCANYPVQRAALSVMANAIIRHKDSMDDFRDRYPNDWVRMCSTIHDALIDEADDGIAFEIMKMMKADMVAGYLDVYPGTPTDRLVEGGMGASWGQLEDME